MVRFGEMPVQLESLAGPFRSLTETPCWMPGHRVDRPHWCGQPGFVLAHER